MSSCESSCDRAVSRPVNRAVSRAVSRAVNRAVSRAVTRAVTLLQRICLPNFWSSNPMDPMDTKASSMDVAPSPPPTSVNSVRLAAFQLVTSACVPGAVAALARLQVFEALSRAGPNASLTAAEIASLALPGKPINISYLSRLLRLISGKRILRETVTTTNYSDGPCPPASPSVVTERRYALEPIARFLVDDPEHGSFVHILFMHQQAQWSSTWQHLHEAVVDDKVNPFARAHGGLSVWEYMKQNAEFDAVFNKGMAANSKVYMKAVLDEYKGLEEVKVLVDVGGGVGTAMKQVTERYSNIRAVNFDQPHVISACKPIPRVEHVAGNMFESVPNDGDAIFMKHILHDWDDESCVKILTKCYQALPPDGKVIALDNMLPEIINFEGADYMALQTDILMMAFTEAGAGERSEGDYRKLGLAAGFRQVEVVCKVDMIAVTEFQK